MNYKHQTQCRFFNGYKPCSKVAIGNQCNKNCTSLDIPKINILFIHLGAIGAVVRSTSLLEGIHKKYPGCRLTWVTDSPSHQLLKNHPLIDHVWTTSEGDLLEASVFDYEIAFVVDKSKKASGVLRRLKADCVYGFYADPRSGAILPANKSALELWNLGLDDEKKFHSNKKPETQLMWEALELGPYSRSPYNLPLFEDEKKIVLERNALWKKNSHQSILGINTGCSNAIPYKKWTVEYHRALIEKLLNDGYQNIVLLGGPEDHERNNEIAKNFPIVNSPTQSGLRDGYISVMACDLIVTGDSLGLHLAIAAQKHVIAWFGPTCAHEIDIYDRGAKLISDFNCSPCWKRICQKEQMCYDSFPLHKVVETIKSQMNKSAELVILQNEYQKLQQLQMLQHQKLQNEQQQNEQQTLRLEIVKDIS